MRQVKLSSCHQNQKQQHQHPIKKVNFNRFRNVEKGENLLLISL